MSELVKNVSESVMDICANEKLCDWEQVIRVTRMAIKIAQQEKTANMEIVQLASLLHVLANPNYNVNEIGYKQIAALLKGHQAKHEIISEVLSIAEKVYFQGSGVQTEMISLEGKIVQDAYRLETIGAVGIANLFIRGEQQNKYLYIENEKIKKHATLEAYLNSKTSVIGSFQEESYLIKDRMNTLAGKRIAAKRHTFMKKFETQFKTEWLGQDADPIIDKIEASSPWQDPYFQKFMKLMENALREPVKFEKIGFVALPLTEKKKKKKKEEEE